MISMNATDVRFGGGGALDGVHLGMDLYTDRDGYGPHWDASSHDYGHDYKASFEGTYSYGQLNLTQTSILGVKAMQASCKGF